MRKPNDVGAAWAKTNEYGDYLSISLDLAILVDLVGGVVEKVNLNAYPIVSDKETAPIWQFKYYPPREGAGAAPARRPEPPAAPARRPDFAAQQRPAPRQAPYQAPPQQPRQAPRQAPRQYEPPPPDPEDDIPF